MTSSPTGSQRGSLAGVIHHADLHAGMGEAHAPFLVGHVHALDGGGGGTLGETPGLQDGDVQRLRGVVHELGGHGRSPGDADAQRGKVVCFPFGVVVDHEVHGDHHGQEGHLVLLHHPEDLPALKGSRSTKHRSHPEAAQHDGDAVAVEHGHHHEGAVIVVELEHADDGVGMEEEVSLGEHGPLGHAGGPEV